MTRPAYQLSAATTGDRSAAVRTQQQAGARQSDAGAEVRGENAPRRAGPPYRGPMARPENLSRDPDDHPHDDPEADRGAGSSRAEQLLTDQVPPADAETAPATHRADIHHRDPGQPRDFLDRLAHGD